MFVDYESDVLRDYHEKKAAGALSTNLSHPTPAKLKKECIVVLDRRYLKKDEITLSSFFELREDAAAYRLAIKKWEADKFRPLNAVLKRGTGKTDEKNIELLAWLIGFQPRPYASWLKDQSRKDGDTSHEVAEEVLEEKTGREQSEVPEQVRERKADGFDSSGSQRASSFMRRNQTIILAILFVIIGIASYLFTSHHRLSGQEKCMYWAGDHYEPISCSEKPADTTLMVLALDSVKLVHFKRITRADTLTASSLGKIWYVKTNSGIEYYTSPGEHPLYPD